MNAEDRPFSYILDTSALITYLTGEKKANKIGRYIKSCALPFIVFSEIYYVVWNKKGKAEADRIYGIVKSWNLPILLPDEQAILNSGRLKAIYKLGLADSYIAAFALVLDKPLITIDTDYKPLSDEIKILFP